MAARWQNMSIAVEDRPLSDALGARIPPAEQPLRVGATLRHWADPDLARAWFSRARALLESRAAVGGRTLEQLDAETPFTPPAAGSNRLPAWAYQRDWLRALLECLAQGYNALNIVWWTDPAARAAYRYWIAGLPDETTRGNAEASLFYPLWNYSDNWYMPSPRHFPVLRALGAEPLGRAGELSRRAVGMFRSLSGATASHPMEVHGRAGLTLTVPANVAGGVTDARVALEPVVLNVPWVLMRQDAACPSPAAFPFLCDRAPTAFGKIPGTGAPVPDGQDDWRSFWYGMGALGGEPAEGVTLGVAAPARHHVLWLADWVRLVSARTPGQIVQDARGYVAWSNKRTMDAFGTPADFVRAVLSVEADVFAQTHRRDPTLDVVAGGVAAVGAALGSATSGISVVVGAVIAGAITVINTLLERDPEGHGRDDLGRWKPVLERGWISGNVAYPTGSRSGEPAFDVPDPPGGVTRLGEAAGGVVGLPGAGGSSGTQLPPGGCGAPGNLFLPACAPELAAALAERTGLAKNDLVALPHGTLLEAYARGDASGGRAILEPALRGEGSGGGKALLVVGGLGLAAAAGYALLRGGGRR